MPAVGGMQLRDAARRRVPGRYREDNRPVDPDRPTFAHQDVVFNKDLARECAFPSLDMNYPGRGPSEIWKERQKKEAAANCVASGRVIVIGGDTDDDSETEGGDDDDTDSEEISNEEEDDDYEDEEDNEPSVPRRGERLILSVKDMTKQQQDASSSGSRSLQQQDGNLGEAADTVMAESETKAGDNRQHILPRRLAISVTARARSSSPNTEIPPEGPTGEVVRHTARIVSLGPRGPRLSFLGASQDEDTVPRSPREAPDERFQLRDLSRSLPNWPELSDGIKYIIMYEMTQSGLSFTRAAWRLSLYFEEVANLIELIIVEEGKVMKYNKDIAKYYGGTTDISWIDEFVATPRPALVTDVITEREIKRGKAFLTFLGLPEIAANLGYYQGVMGGEYEIPITHLEEDGWESLIPHFLNGCQEDVHRIWMAWKQEQSLKPRTMSVGELHVRMDAPPRTVNPRRVTEVHFASRMEAEIADLVEKGLHPSNYFPVLENGERVMADGTTVDREILEAGLRVIEAFQIAAKAVANTVTGGEPMEVDAEVAQVEREAKSQDALRFSSQVRGEGSMNSLASAAPNQSAAIQGSLASDTSEPGLTQDGYPIFSDSDMAAAIPPFVRERSPTVVAAANQILSEYRKPVKKINKSGEITASFPNRKAASQPSEGQQTAPPSTQKRKKKVQFADDDDGDDDYVEEDTTSKKQTTSGGGRRSQKEKDKPDTPTPTPSGRKRKTPRLSGDADVSEVATGQPGGSVTSARSPVRKTSTRAAPVKEGPVKAGPVKGTASRSSAQLLEDSGTADGNKKTKAGQPKITQNQPAFPPNKPSAPKPPQNSTTRTTAASLLPLKNMAPSQPPLPPEKSSTPRPVQSSASTTVAAHEIPPKTNMGPPAPVSSQPQSRDPESDSGPASMAPSACPTLEAMFVPISPTGSNIVQRATQPVPLLPQPPANEGAEKSSTHPGESVMRTGSPPNVAQAHAKPDASRRKSDGPPGPSDLDPKLPPQSRKRKSYPGLTNSFESVIPVKKPPGRGTVSATPEPSGGAEQENPVSKFTHPSKTPIPIPTIPPPKPELGGAAEQETPVSQFSRRSHTPIPIPTIPPQRPRSETPQQQEPVKPFTCRSYTPIPIPLPAHMLEKIPGLAGHPLVQQQTPTPSTNDGSFIRAQSSGPASTSAADASGAFAAAGPPPSHTPPAFQAETSVTESPSQYMLNNRTILGGATGSRAETEILRNRARTKAARGAAVGSGNMSSSSQLPSTQLPSTQLPSTPRANGYVPAASSFAAPQPRHASAPANFMAMLDPALFADVTTSEAASSSQTATVNTAAEGHGQATAIQNGRSSSINMSSASSAAPQVSTYNQTPVTMPGRSFMNMISASAAGPEALTYIQTPVTMPSGSIHMNSGGTYHHQFQYGFTAGGPMAANATYARPPQFHFQGHVPPVTSMPPMVFGTPQGANTGNSSPPPPWILGSTRGAQGFPNGSSASFSGPWSQNMIQSPNHLGNRTGTGNSYVYVGSSAASGSVPTTAPVQGITADGQEYLQGSLSDIMMRGGNNEGNNSQFPFF
ncbi:hypothetical protein B0H66DRAFT_533786 [Apodospora peruviana]|uniref:Uncharacterized protein n=1 Tax=Apodospora peruviana TaxID=516989 RepID=A0AAE0I6D5_9PEZI|nr:hypothetical protein B0H66DRAFT_533786 [Apodospora peruviana]